MKKVWCFFGAKSTKPRGITYVFITNVTNHTKCNPNRLQATWSIGQKQHDLSYCFSCLNICIYTTYLKQSQYHSVYTVYQEIPFIRRVNLTHSFWKSAKHLSWLRNMYPHASIEEKTHRRKSLVPLIFFHLYMSVVFVLFRTFVLLWRFIFFFFRL